MTRRLETRLYFLHGSVRVETSWTLGGPETGIGLCLTTKKITRLRICLLANTFVEAG